MFSSPAMLIMIVHFLEEQTVRRISRGGAERREPLLAVNLTAEEPEVVRRSPSPPRNTKNSIIHVANLVRPYTLNQLKELLGRTGTLVADGFWIDKIKSHCYASVSYNISGIIISMTTIR